MRAKRITVMGEYPRNYLKYQKKSFVEFSSKSLMEHVCVCDGNMKTLYSNRITKCQKSGVRFRSCTRTTCYRFHLKLEFVKKNFVKFKVQ